MADPRATAFCFRVPSSVNAWDTSARSTYLIVRQTAPVQKSFTSALSFPKGRVFSYQRRVFKFCVLRLASNDRFCFSLVCSNLRSMSIVYKFFTVEKRPKSYDKWLNSFACVLRSFCVDHRSTDRHRKANDTVNSLGTSNVCYIFLTYSTAAKRLKIHLTCF